jgi:hypothetical protein
MEIHMNRFLAAMAIAVAVGSTPAMAQSWDPDVGSGNIAPAPYGETLNGASRAQHGHAGFNAFAQAPGRYVARHRGPSLNRSNDVIEDNQVVGADPDINVRSQLMRDNKETEF